MHKKVNPNRNTLNKKLSQKINVSCKLLSAEYMSHYALGLHKLSSLPSQGHAKKALNISFHGTLVAYTTPFSLGIYMGFASSKNKFKPPIHSFLWRKTLKLFWKISTEVFYKDINSLNLLDRGDASYHFTVRSQHSLVPKRVSLSGRNLISCSV